MKTPYRPELANQDVGKNTAGGLEFTHIRMFTSGKPPAGVLQRFTSQEGGSGDGEQSLSVQLVPFED
jgi:hypothetical protein